MYSLHHIILFAEKCNIVSLVPLSKNLGWLWAAYLFMMIIL